MRRLVVTKLPGVLKFHWKSNVRKQDDNNNNIMGDKLLLNLGAKFQR